jgi:hypothetical protein
MTEKRKYDPHDFSDDLDHWVLSALPPKQAVAASLSTIENIKLTDEERGYLVMLAEKKNSFGSDHGAGRDRHPTYNDCDTEFERGIKHARTLIIQAVLKALQVYGGRR